MRTPTKSQFSGCLIGQCLGDALGFLREGWPREDCEKYVRGPMLSWRLSHLDEDAWAGQYTDDSQLARELMQSYAACKGFDYADYSRRIAAIFVEERIVGGGTTTRQAAMRLAAGAAWEVAGTPPPSAGNGSAMRAAPIGLLCDDPRRLIQAAHDQGRITHQDRRSSAGAVAIAGAVFLALRMETIDKRTFVSQLADWTAELDQQFAAYVRRLDDCLSLPFEDALDEIADMGADSAPAIPWDRISPFVIPSVIWSLYSFLQSPADYWDAIGAAIRVGGDVDTTAAITGAISGAHLGLEGLPHHLATHVNDFGTWGYDELVTLADRCYELSIRQ